MNRHWLFGVALLLPCVVRAAPQAPFAPLPDVPDFVATMTVKLHHGPTYREQRTHHGGWTRVDGSFDRSAYRSTSYFGPREIFIMFAREPLARAEATDWLTVMRGPAMAHLIRWGDSSSKTGESEQALGETCEVWSLKSSRRSLGANERQLSCVTPDGIEMWSRTEGSPIPTDSFQVDAMTRRPVSPDEVRPPSQRLDLQPWLTVTGNPSRPSDALPDATVVLKNKSTSWTRGWSSHTIQTRTVRRHYPWTYTEDADDKGLLKTRYRNEIAGLEIEYERDAVSGPIGLNIQKALSDKVLLRDDPRRVPEKSNDVRTILGETCARSEDGDGMHESWSECRTDDGLMLEASYSGNHGLHDLSAVKIDRAPVPLEAVQPPREIFVWSTWGVPD